MDKPWIELDPNDMSTYWWTYPEVIEINNEWETHTNKPRDIKNIKCYFIIQDCSITGNFWHVSSWYTDNPLRHYNLLYPQDWDFNKRLDNMKHNDIIYMLNYPNIKFKVFDCKYVTPKQNKFCKILERI